MCFANGLWQVFNISSSGNVVVREIQFAQRCVSNFGDALGEVRKILIYTAYAGVNSIIIVVSPLNSLMSGQISRLSESSGIQASIIDVKELKRKDKDISSDEDMDDDNCFNVDIDFPLCEKKKLRIRDGRYHNVFPHPETLISSKYGLELLLSQ